MKRQTDHSSGNIPFRERQSIYTGPSLQDLEIGPLHILLPLVGLLHIVSAKNKEYSIIFQKQLRKLETPLPIACIKHIPRWCEIVYLCVRDRESIRDI